MSDHDVDDIAFLTGTPKIMILQVYEKSRPMKRLGYVGNHPQSRDLQHRSIYSIMLFYVVLKILYSMNPSRKGKEIFV